MGIAVTNGASMMCTMGMAPATLIVLPVPPSRPTKDGQAYANINDHQPIVNITTFGMCRSPANPTVAAATAAALGVLTPMPCIPNTVTPWVPPKPTVMMGGAPAIDNSAQCMCMWAGTITFTVPGSAMQTMIS